MGVLRIKMPDIGEGIAEAELVEWHVAVGSLVKEDEVIASVMTDKATVEIPSSVSGTVVALGGEVGAKIAIGSDLIRMEVAGISSEAPDRPANVADVATRTTQKPTRVEQTSVTPQAAKQAPIPHPPLPAADGLPAAVATAVAPRMEGEKALASPAVRLRAREAGIDLRQVKGSGPARRVTHADLDAVFAQGSGPSHQAAGQDAGRQDTSIKDVKVVGMRRMIADKMSLSKSRIPHITYVEEVDVTKVEELRARLNATKRDARPKLTMLPFLIRAMVLAIRDEPSVNAIFDDDIGVVHQYGGVHIGMAVQTPNGLMVANVRHCEARDVWDTATELNRLADAARKGRITLDELRGSTITISSLGPLGGISSTPIINRPEVAIVGVNKIQIRPAWDGSQFLPRQMMNLSSSFDHRVIDGWTAATFVQRIKTLLEEPALMFVEP